MQTNPNLKYSSEQIDNRAKYAGLQMYYAVRFGFTGIALKKLVANDFRLLYGKKKEEKVMN